MAGGGRLMALAALAALAGGCSVDLTGALCRRDGDCPDRQTCTQVPSDGGFGSCQPGPDLDAGRAALDAGARCPALGDGEGQGCAMGGAECTSDQRALRCAARGDGCAVWRQVEDCGAEGLVCVGAEARCDCPEVDGAAPVLHVDPTASFADGGPGRTRTGAASPATCAFLTLGDALVRARALMHAQAGDGGVVALELSGHPAPLPPAWAPRHTYAAGETVVPSRLNGWRYTADVGGQSGAVEPAWLGDGGATLDGALAWRREGPASPVRLIESAALVLPGALTIENPACPGPQCDPRVFAVSFPSAPADAAAVVLAQGDSLSGFSIVDPPGPALSCGGDGGAIGVTLSDLVLAAPGGGANPGIAVSDGCTAALTRVRARGFHTGFDVGGGVVHLSACRTDGCGTGLRARAGAAFVSDGTAFEGGVNGVVAQATAGRALEVHLTGAQVRDTEREGVRLVGPIDADGGLPTFEIADLDVGHCNLSGLGLGGLVFDGASAPTVSGLHAHDCPISEVRLTAGARAFDTGGAQISWPFDVPGSPSPRANAVYCYVARGATGLWSAAGPPGGQSSIPAVDARFMAWDRLLPSNTSTPPDYRESLVFSVDVEDSLGVYDGGACQP